jgi:predicted GNAT superfamily acetyltransferase
MLEIKTYSADEFAEFLKANTVESYDRTTGVCWFADKDGKFLCTDRASVHNHRHGGREHVRVVIADSLDEAIRELAAIRST